MLILVANISASVYEVILTNVGLIPFFRMGKTQIKNQYFNQKLKNAKLEHKYLINKNKMEVNKYKMEMKILKLRLMKLQYLRKH